MPKSVKVAAPWLAYVGCAVVMVAATGTSPADGLRYIVYVVAFVLAPGVLAYVALTRSAWSDARTIAVGWALGYVLQPLAFGATAALGARWLYSLYPVIAIAGLGAIVWRRRALASETLASEASSLQPAVTFATTALSLYLLVFMGLGYFAQTPLPGSVASANYFVDLPDHLGKAAEVLHHFPFTDPHVAGTPYAYYFFHFMSLAGPAQAFGIELPVVLLRLYLLPMLLLLPLQYFALGASVSGKRAVGLLAATLAIAFGEMDTSVAEPSPFTNYGLGYWRLSGSFTQGLVLMLAMLIEVVRATEPRRMTRGDWLAMVLLLIGCGATKASTLPVLLGGVALFAAFRRSRRALGIAVLATLVLVAFQLTTYSAMNVQVRVSPFAAVLRMPQMYELWQSLAARAPIGAQAYSALAAIPAVLGFVGFAAFGVIALVVRLRGRWPDAPLLLACVALTGFGAFMLFDYENGGQGLYAYYAMPAVNVLAAMGFWGLWESRARLSGVAIVALLALFALPALASALDAPFDVREAFTRLRRGQLTYDAAPQLTRGLYEGLVWLRANSDPDDVIAVNNQLVDKTIYLRPTPHNFYYSALSERRVFLEGYAYTNEAHKVGYKDVESGRVHPFPERQRLNDRVFQVADADALGVLARDYGVRYLVVDKLHGPASADLAHIARRVFDNADVAIFAVAPPTR